MIPSLAQEEVLRCVEFVVSALVNRDYAGLESRKQLGRLTIIELLNAIGEYPGVLTMPPKSAYDSLTVYDVYDPTLGARKAEFDLWVDGKPSDLTLSLDIKSAPTGGYIASIDDLHVL